MSHLSELVAELCPNGVEVATLGDVGTFTRGNGLQKKDLDDNGVGAIHYGQIFTHYGTVTKATKSFVTAILAKKLRRAKQGDLVIATTSENDEDVCKAVAWLGADEIAVSGDAYIYSHTLDPRYVAYFFQSSDFGAQKSRYVTGTKVRRVNGADLARIKIPVPPHAVQQEIAGILQKMEQLEAELKAELQSELRARRRQYEYLRNGLLTSHTDDSVWLTLREVALDFGRGKSRHRPRNDPKLYGGLYPFIQTGDIRTSSHVVTAYSQTYSEDGLAQSKLWPRGTICITIAANIAETGILGFDACFPDSVIGMVVDPQRASAHFVEYLLQAYRASLVAKGQGSAQANINLATFENERFPFPTLEVQEAIVAVLDKFEGAVELIVGALCEELAARRKQYECYRDTLLTFTESA
ncbi:MAG: Restriction endonuclease subunit [Marmoricola sp.]|nr:Restriction endonuclease subunit [Marmoricola sp.]